MAKFSNSQKGVSLYITLILTSIILAVALGISLLLVGQLKITREIGDSTKAFFAADAGMEQALNLSYDAMLDSDNIDQLIQTNIFGDEYGYEVKISCCKQDDGLCQLSDALPCPDSLSSTDECTDTGANYFCYKSKGTYKGVSRAIEITR